MGELDTELDSLAGAISAARRTAAAAFAERVRPELVALALPYARLVFDIQLGELGPHGADQVELLFSANPGSEPQSLAKVASGGELSRIRLALEVVLAEGQSAATLVFDEVDAGVGGRVAVEIGRRLAHLARHSQVIVVTHLAQVAAFADRHYVVVKSDDGQVTTSGVQLVSDSERAAELARMMAGLETTEVALAHAGELVELAESVRGSAKRPNSPAVSRVYVRNCHCARDFEREEQFRTYTFETAEERGLRGRMSGEMRLPTLLRRRGAPTEIGGVIRLDRRTKDLTKRLRPGEIAIIHHTDLDRVSAEALVKTGVSAVINAVPSVSGRYPNLGPGILMDAGIVLIDDVGEAIFNLAHEGERASLDGGKIYGPHGMLLAEGELYTTEILEEQLQYAREGLADQIEAFAENTMVYLREEKELLLEGIGVPDVATQIEGRHVLIVVRGYDYRSDLDALRPYISEYRPLLMGVDGGADALIEAGYKPDMIIGDMDSCSDETLRCGAELVVHAYHDGRAPGLERISALGLDAVVFPALGTSEDAAMLLADTKGAPLLVAVGSHFSLVEFLDKGRAGMASTLLTRLRVGSKLVDAKGVSRIYRSQIRTWQLVLLVLSGLLALVTALLVTDVGWAIGSLIGARIRDFLYWVKELFT